jgi:tRNA A37 threonylcarbamoyladenosine synthetase subunit TsaC/SUA5/YrdC
MMVGSAAPQPVGLPGSLDAPYLRLGDPGDEAVAAEALAAGGVVGYGFGNIYALVARPERDAVRSANRMKGRPPEQTGSVVTTPIRVPLVYDWARLPSGLTRSAVLDVMDALFAVGPIGFRGPADDVVPIELSQTDSVTGMRTTQVIAPGYACPSNAFVAACLRRTGGDLLYITSANLSHHEHGGPEEPPHFRAGGLAADFATEDLCLLRHCDEEQVRGLYPLHAPMSTTLIAFHRTAGRDDDGRVLLLVERHGSLPVEEVRRLLSPLGFGVVLAPDASRRLPQRAYAG